MNFHSSATKETMETMGWTYMKDMGGEWFQKQVGYLRVSVTAKFRVYTLDRYNGYMTTEYYEDFDAALDGANVFLKEAVRESRKQLLSKATLDPKLKELVENLPYGASISIDREAIEILFTFEDGNFEQNAQDAKNLLKRIRSIQKAGE